MTQTKLLPGDEWFDEIRIVTLPRYKVSGLSGDEWRTSARVRFFRKGVQILETGWKNIDTASRWLAWALVEDEMDDVRGDSQVKFPADYCSQPGCPEKPVTVYGIKTHYEPNGSLSEWQPSGQTRQFCSRHAQRGNSELEDQDHNYEVRSGPGPEGGGPEPGDISEAAFLGTLDLRDVDAEGDWDGR